jgi:type IV pilus assembly protein PilB
MKVLVAEDDTVSRMVVKKTVEKLGHECLAAVDGEEAWGLYLRDPDIDAIVSDWMMPNMDGLELCRRVRGLEREGYTFFVFLTALGGREHLLEGMRAGADEYLVKPLDAEQLRAKLLEASRVTALHRHMRAEADDLEKSTAGAVAEETAQRPQRKIAGKVWDVLISQGKLTEEQVQKALAERRGHPVELGRTLVSLGYISESDLAQANAERLNLDFVELSEANVDPGAAALVPEKVLRRHGALPLSTDNGHLTVAMSEPTNIYALEDLRMISGRKVVPVVATEADIQRMLNRTLALGGGVADILEEAAEEPGEIEGELDLAAGAGAEEAPVVRLVGSILQRAVGEGASDVHIEPQARELKVRLRVDGVLRDFMSIPPKLQSGVIARLKILANLDIAERRIPQDGRFSVRLGGNKVDLRVASLPTVYGEEVVLRLLDTSNLQTSLEGLGFEPEVLARYEGVYRRPYGTILVTGPTGSGKSTTLYATLQALNSPERKIITVEDPVEYRLAGINQVQVNPRAGLTFASGLRSILRADPDVVMIGEIRDPETAKTAVEAALTGHLVLSTLHTNNAPAAVSRLTEMGVEPYLTASAVDCVIAQRLARRLCERCKEPISPEREVLAGMGFPFERALEEPRFHRPVGCQHCGGTGYRGRIGIYELMVVTDEVKDLVLRRAPTTEISRAAERGGMVRLRADGLLKASRGLTTIEEVLRTVV